MLVNLKTGVRPMASCIAVRIIIPPNNKNNNNSILAIMPKLIKWSKIKDKI
ncbi:hypothetical protein ID0186_06620 [Helicobacter pylori]|nr:hypothetical protein VN1175_11530 [Helicobacter pylori]